MALSHCWGGNIPCKTLDAILSVYQKALPDNLPQNFLDAIEVTRALGKKYLWIDALYIIQDSEKDWKAEASKMTDYYSNAWVTISAMDAKSSDGGFLRRQSPAALVSPEYAIQSLLPDVSKVLPQCCIESRGWCLQEQLFSPALLHFGKDQMFWECCTCAAAESDGPGHIIKRLSPCNRLNASSFDRIALRNSLVSGPDASLWYSLLEEFTRRSLTHATDKLPVLSGLARRFRAENKTYQAGLWGSARARNTLETSNSADPSSQGWVLTYGSYPG
jgi:hypothetical protein